MRSDISKELAIEFYRKMKLIRAFEEKVVELVNRNEIYGTTHECTGQEAVAVGVCSALDEKDYLTSTHRGHGHMIAKGGDIGHMFSELMGKKNGCNCGKGGSMHISDPDLGVLGANGIVGAGVPIAVGAALALKMKNTGRIVASFYGDGASNQGVVHEAMNMASVWNLPVIFVCENNLYAVSTPIAAASKIENLSERAAAYGFTGITVDGMDVAEVFTRTRELVEKCRKGEGPFLLECKTYRFHGHFTAEPFLGLRYRTDVEVAQYRERCPVAAWAKKLSDEYFIQEEEIESIDRETEALIGRALEFARDSPFPEEEEAFEDMYATRYEGIPQRGKR